MDGKRIQQYWSQEIKALIATYKQFEMLLPSEDGSGGSSHHPEDGRFVESLLKTTLEKFLPKELEVLTGFVLRAAVKTNNTNKERKGELDQHSTQIDLIVYDSANFPVYQRFGDTCIVPPEGVVALISVKKHLRNKDVANECKALKEASSLCKTLNTAKKARRRPYLALVSMGSNVQKPKTVFKKMNSAYNSETDDFDDLIGMVSVLDKWTIFKGMPNDKKKTARYVSFDHAEEEEHLGLQFLLTGILSVYYDETRKSTGRPGFTAFPNGAFKEKAGEIPYGIA